MSPARHAVATIMRWRPEPVFRRQRHDAGRLLRTRTLRTLKGQSRDRPAAPGWPHDRMVELLQTLAANVGVLPEAHMSQVLQAFSQGPGHVWASCSPSRLALPPGKPGRTA